MCVSLRGVYVCIHQKLQLSSHPLQLTLVTDKAEHDVYIHPQPPIAPCASVESGFSGGPHGGNVECAAVCAFVGAK